MAVKNGEEYLRTATNSILAQTFSDFEFIIIDDGSNDHTGFVLVECAAQDNRVVLIHNETNVGLTRSLNHGLEIARGEYIARMDADDISLPERLTTQVSFLDSHPEIGVAGTGAYLVDANGSVVSRVQYPAGYDQLHWSMCFFENPIIHPSVMFRRKVVKDLGGYDESYTTSQDYDLWSRVLRKTKLVNIQETLLHLRKHELSVSRLQYQQQQKSSLEISASLISSVLGFRVQPAQIQSYCDFLWNQTAMSEGEASFIAGLIFRLAKGFLRKSQIAYSDRSWITNNAVSRLNTLKEKQKRPRMMQMKLAYLKWLLNHSFAQK